MLGKFSIDYEKQNHWNCPRVNVPWCTLTQPHVGSMSDSVVDLRCALQPTVLFCTLLYLYMIMQWNLNYNHKREIVEHTCQTDVCYVKINSLSIAKNSDDVATRPHPQIAVKDVSYFLQYVQPMQNQWQYCTIAACAHRVWVRLCAPPKCCNNADRVAQAALQWLALLRWENVHSILRATLTAITMKWLDVCGDHSRGK